MLDILLSWLAISIIVALIVGPYLHFNAREE